MRWVGTAQKKRGKLSCNIICGLPEKAQTLELQTSQSIAEKWRLLLKYKAIPRKLDNQDLGRLLVQRFSPNNMAQL